MFRHKYQVSPKLANKETQTMDQKLYKCFRYKMDCAAYFIFRAIAKLVLFDPDPFNVTEITPNCEASLFTSLRGGSRDFS